MNPQSTINNQKSRHGGISPVTIELREEFRDTEWPGCPQPSGCWDGNWKHERAWRIDVAVHFAFLLPDWRLEGRELLVGPGGRRRDYVEYWEHVVLAKNREQALNCLVRDLRKDCGAEWITHAAVYRVRPPLERAVVREIERHNGARDARAQAAFAGRAEAGAGPAIGIGVGVMGMDGRDSIDRGDLVDERNGYDIDIWGDGRATESTPIPEWWDFCLERIRDDQSVADRGGGGFGADGAGGGDGVSGAGGAGAGGGKGLRLRSWATTTGWRRGPWSSGSGAGAVGLYGGVADDLLAGDPSSLVRFGVIGRYDIIQSGAAPAGNLLPRFMQWLTDTLGVPETVRASSYLGVGTGGMYDVDGTGLSWEVKPHWGVQLGPVTFELFRFLDDDVLGSAADVAQPWGWNAGATFQF